MSGDPTFLGTVQDVEGATVGVVLNQETVSGLTFVDGRPYRVGQVGSLIRFPIGYVDLVGIVSQVGAGAVPERLAGTEPFGHRWMKVQIVGEGYAGRAFSRGVSQLPGIGDPVHIVTEPDLERIYGRPDSPEYVSIGRVASAEGISALLDLNKLVTRHVAVVGTTGAGKSTTVARIVSALTDTQRYRSARVVVFDLHGEYGSALSDRATSFRVSESPDLASALYVPYWALNLDELLPMTFGAITDDAGLGGVRDEILRLKRETLARYPIDGVDPDRVSVDSPVPFSIHQLWFDLHRQLNATHTAPPTGQDRDTEALVVDEDGSPIDAGDAMRVAAPRYRPATQAAGEEKVYLSGSALNIRRNVDALASRLRDPRFDFLFRPGPWLPDTGGRVDEDLDSFLAQWLGSGTPVCILDLSGVPSTVVRNLVGALTRLVYDALFWGRRLSEGGRERPLLIVFEEAHAYLGRSGESVASLAVERVVKEGRKYGVGAMIVSQRPSEIDPTILSQCGTTLAMRLANATDRNQVSGTVTENLVGLLGMLPVLRTGEAIVVGEAVPLPMRVLVALPAAGRLPDSADPHVVGSDEDPGGWNRDREPQDWGDVVHTWRTQDPASRRIFDTGDEETDA